MTFKSRIDPYHFALLLLILVLYNTIPVYSLMKSEIDTMEYIQFIPFFAFSILIIIGSKQTNYKVKNGILIVKGLFINETIPIHRIHSISKETKLLPNFKSSAARSGLLLKYQTSYSVFITPSQQNAFIKQLLDVNKHIDLINSQELQTNL
ncbi:PH domain-containing protein [Psychroflexus tropicus]|uniref:PH domain-containing protein n=1 Tax=Psychroflexus tropicus TaxID=197345 RepID=UPI00037C562F|nr:PH domain-containing protein [Psychroflexus tropicus]